MRILLLAMMMGMGTIAQAQSTNYFLYVGVYGKGIPVYRFDANNGHLKPAGLAGSVVNPSWVTVGPHDRYLFAVSELEGKAEGAVASFAIDRHTGKLHELNSMPSGGVAPCHIAIDHTGKMLFVANYTTGGVGVFPIEPDGRLGSRASLLMEHGHSINPKRQEGPHAHETLITADNRMAYVADLGLDRIRIYRIDPEHTSATPNDPPFVKEEAGYGPRHMAFGTGEKYLYLATELKSFVTVFKRDPQNGNLTAIQKISTLPKGFTGFNGPAELVIDHAGKHVYVTNRGANTIAVYGIDQATGKLHEVQNISSEGDFPRGFALDPTGQYAFAGNQKSNNFVVYRVDQNTGRLTFTGENIHVSSPVDFAFVPAE